MMTLLLRNRGKEERFEDEVKEEPEEFVQSGPPASAGPPISVQEPTISMPTETFVQPRVETGPALPEGGLPAGWSEEQWSHYGQQYLDRLEGQA